MAPEFSPLILYIRRCADKNSEIVASIALENRHNWSLLLLYGVLINNIIGAAWAAGTIAFGNVHTSSQIGYVFICCLSEISS